MTLHDTAPVSLNHTITVNPSCRRKCLHHGSKIYYAEETDGGLDDRIYIITALANLAGFLCAELILKPPSQLLQPYHNGNNKLSVDLEWPDFLNVTNINDGSPVLHSAAKEFGNYSWTTNQPSPPCYDSQKRFNEKCIAFDSGEDSIYHGWLHIASTMSNWQNVQNEFQQIYNASFTRDWDKSNPGFLWEIHMSWWTTRLNLDGMKEMSPPTTTTGAGMQFDRTNYLKMLPSFQTHWPPIDNGKGCSYVQVDYSSSIKLMQKSFINEVRRHALDDASIGLLHLRRGDATGICDTSIDKVKEYLYCSLGGMVGLRPSITLVMTSDEKDNGYRSEVMGIIDEFAHITMIDGDQIAQRVVAEAAESGLITKAMVNNFVVFAVEAILRDPTMEDKTERLIDFRLTRRRKYCPDCESNQVL